MSSATIASTTATLTMMSRNPSSSSLTCATTPASPSTSAAFAAITATTPAAVGAAESPSITSMAPSASSALNGGASASVSGGSSSASTWLKRKRCSSSSLEDGHTGCGGSLKCGRFLPASGRDAAVVAVAQPAQQRRVFIKLASESPQPSDDETGSASTDDSLYGSVHARETDFCRDTSDTDSYSTDEFAMLDVIEYELPSESSASELLYSNDSSSGTDDFVVTAAQLARALFNSQHCDTDGQSANDAGSSGQNAATAGRSSAGSTDSESATAVATVAAVAAAAMLDDCASDARTEFELFADTEESDAPTDPELGRADYWTCVKCKNHQNNPMYRYCERCYQIRKTHFPPRPKLQKTRSRNSGRTLNSPRGPQSEQLQQQQRRRHRYRRTQSSSSSSASSTASSSSASSESDDDDDRILVGVVDVQNDSVEIIEGNRRSSVGLRQLQRQTVHRTHARSHVPPSVRRTSANSADSDNTDAHSASDDEDMFRTSQAVAAAPPTHLSLLSASLPDSGFQSSSTSADLTPSDVPSTLTIAAAAEAASSQPADTQQSTDLRNSSQDTYCSDVEAQAAASGGCPSTNAAVAVAATSSSSTLSNASSMLELPAAVQRSLSDSSAASGAVSLTTQSSTTSAISSSSSMGTAVNCAGGGGDDSSYGMCMMCLTEPKNGVFVHSRFLHLCCCYRCAVKVWNKQKRCPICNCKVKNVMKLFVH